MNGEGKGDDPFPGKRPRRKRTPVLLVLLPRCPWCDSKKLSPYDRRYYDFFEIRYCKCRQCGANVNLRVEWPLTRELPPER